MEALSFRNNYIQNQPSEVQKKLQKEENFTALDADRLKQDTVEIAGNVKDNANENFLFKTLRNFGVDNPKKLLKSIGLAIGTVIGVMILGNKFSTPAIKLGNKIDSVLAGDNLIGKTRNQLIGLLKQGAKTIKKAPKPKFVENAKKALDTPAKPKWSIFRGLEQGAKGLFSNTVKETISVASEKNKPEVIKTLSSLLGNNTAKAETLVEEMGKISKAGSNMTNVKFADKLLDEIAKTNKCENDPAKLTEILIKLKDGGFGDGLNNVAMTKGGFLASWWPANAVNKVIKTITKKDCKYLQGNLGDSLLKYAAIRGKLGKTMPAKTVQIIPPLVGDYVSNFVNDKSGFGVLLCATLVSNYNNLQDAPKDKKVSTALNDVASGSLSWLIGMPISYGIVYGLASLAKTEGKDVMSRLTRTIGKFFAMGLEKPGKLGGVKGVAGGIMRFAMVLFVISPFVGKKINALCSKLFGKPYDSAKAEQEKKLEEEQNKIIPELNITQKELQERIEKNPKAMESLQNNPDMVKALEKNPKLLLDILDNKEVNPQEILKQPQSKNNSPMLDSMLNKNQKDLSNQTDLFGSKTKEKTKQKEETTKPKDTATYIPSSDFIAKDQTLSDETSKEYQRLMTNADKVLVRAEKYI